mgnify:CR=1 FL=1
MKNRLFVLCTILFVCIATYAVQVWDGTAAPWTKGSGTESNPYLIETPANIAYLSKQVQDGNAYDGTYFLQTDDIDLNNKSWTYIGAGTSKPFSGIYDGGQKHILNIKNYLFGYIKSATIKNLTIAGSSTYSMVYNVIGDVTLINCHNKSTADIEKGGAGLISSAEKGLLTLIGCSNSATIHSAVLYLHDVNYGRQSNDVFLGGLIAKANKVKVSKCVHKGNFKYAQSGYTRINAAYVAAVAGYADTIQITQSGNNGGDIDIKSNSTYGPGRVYECGLMGYCASNPIVSQSYSVGGPISSGTNSYCYAIMNDGSLGGTCINCYIVVQETTCPVNSSSVNCYYNNDCRVEQTQYNKATQQTKEMMKSPSFVSLLNVDGDYFYPDYTNINDGYPILRWQLEGTTMYKIRATCPSAQGVVSGSGEYPATANITLKAIPKDGYAFTGWSDGNTDNPRTITVNGNATYVAQFSQSAYTIYVNQDCTTDIE